MCENYYVCAKIMCENHCKIKSAGEDVDFRELEKGLQLVQVGFERFIVLVEGWHLVD